MSERAGELPPVDVPNPRELVRSFVSAVDCGMVRAELGEDCIFSFFGRQVRGVAATVGYVRSQLLGRFHHVRFNEAQVVSQANELILRERFSRYFDLVRRRICEQKERERASTLHLRAESDDEELLGRCPEQLVTPPRAASQDMELLSYVEGRGVLESQQDSHYHGGLDLGDTVHVHLTLGYRRIPGLPPRRPVTEICLMVYEKLPLKLNRSTLPQSSSSRGIRSGVRMRSSSVRGNDHTDDESDEPAPAPSPARRGVRRTLFANAADLMDPELSERADQAAEPQAAEQQEAVQDTSAPVPVPLPLPADADVDAAGDSSAIVNANANAAAESGAAPQEEPLEVRPGTSAGHSAPPAENENRSAMRGTPRKRVQPGSDNEVEPKRTPGRNRMRF